MTLASAILIGQLLYKGYKNWDAGRMGDAEKAAQAAVESAEERALKYQAGITAEAKAKQLAPIQGQLDENVSMAGRTAATTGGQSGTDQSSFLEALRVGTGAQLAATSAAAAEQEAARQALADQALQGRMSLVQSELARKGVQADVQAQPSGVTIGQAEEAGSAEGKKLKEQMADFAARVEYS